MYTNKEIWNVSYPIFLGLLAQNIINVTDTVFLGRVVKWNSVLRPWVDCFTFAFLR